MFRVKEESCLQLNLKWFGKTNMCVCLCVYMHTYTFRKKALKQINNGLFKVHFVLFLQLFYKFEIIPKSKSFYRFFFNAQKYLNWI